MAQRPDEPGEASTGGSDAADERADEGARPDPDAPGNFVDADEGSDVPEPNEPG